MSLLRKNSGLVFLFSGPLIFSNNLTRQVDRTVSAATSVDAGAGSGGWSRARIYSTHSESTYVAVDSYTISWQINKANTNS